MRIFCQFGSAWNWHYIYRRNTHVPLTWLEPLLFFLEELEERISRWVSVASCSTSPLSFTVGGSFTRTGSLIEDWNVNWTHAHNKTPRKAMLLVTMDALETTGCKLNGRFLNDWYNGISFPLYSLHIDIDIFPASFIIAYEIRAFLAWPIKTAWYGSWVKQVTESKK